MKTLSDTLIAEKNKLHSIYPWLILVDITLTSGTILRLVQNTEDIIFGGEDYTHFNFELSRVNSNVDGEIPKVTLSVCNITRFLTPYLNDLDGGLASTVKLTVINSSHLPEDYSELELEFTVMGCEADEMWVRWTLSMASPTLQRFPLYRYVACYCEWKFTMNEVSECGYIGSATSCDHTLPACIALGNEENFDGDLGMQGHGFRIV